MITSSRSRVVTLLARATLVALGLSLVAVIAPATSLKAADATVPAAAKLPALPLKAKFDKVSGSEGPYVLKLKNSSKESLKVSAKVLLSVAFHAQDKARNVPEETVAPGKTWKISELAAKDQVIVTAAGYAPLELTVP